MSSPAFTGSCLCGAVKYEIAGPPMKCVACHCNSCQKVTGSVLAANCWFNEKDLNILQGQDSVKIYSEEGTLSGNPMRRSFCGTCGSSLFLQNDRLKDAGRISVTSGTIDQRDTLQPQAEYWCRNRRKWLGQGIEGAEHLDTQ